MPILPGMAARKKPPPKPRPAHPGNGNPVYDPARHPQIAAALAATGKIDKEIAALLGVNPRTIYNWRDKHAEFDAALAEGKEPANLAVEAALFKRACGYEYEDTEAVGIPGGEGKTIIKTVKKVKKHLPPDTTACIFWLKNRCPDRWRDVQQQEHSGDVFLSIVPPPKATDAPETPIAD
jgi:transposase-like protein